MSKVWFPECMTTAEYAEWRAAERRAYKSAGIKAHRPCEDCPLSFQQENLLRGTCNGAVRKAANEPLYPSKRLRQWREASARKRAGIRVRRSQAEINALAHLIVGMRDGGASYSAIGRLLGMDHTYVRDLYLRGSERAA
jgi:hypothetical protein